MNGLGRTMAFILAVVAPLTARVPDTVAELWADFDAHTPLNAAVVRQWEEERTTNSSFTASVRPKVLGRRTTRGSPHIAVKFLSTAVQIIDI